ncbi:MAG: hypothetical protein ACLQGV_16045 [Bryobacteraceae bacterium]
MTDQRNSRAVVFTAQQLIEGPDPRPHVVLLGAGASLASFPNGDADGKPLPLMNDLVEKLGLQALVDEAALGLGSEKNFEVIYSRLISIQECLPIARKIECRIRNYFSELALPNCATIYDRILVSLRPTDAVLTFNWDPFLFDAYQRNRGAIPLPEIFFLHGNVRIGACREHAKWGARNGGCPDCRRMFADVPLLYPISQKNYSEDPHIRRTWEAAKILFKEAFTLTIFGYSAPASDGDACNLLKSAWLARSPRELEHIEVIDTAPVSDLEPRWLPFTPPRHYRIVKTFEESRIARWPRRTSESLFYPMSQGAPCGDFPLPSTNSLPDLLAYVTDIARHERPGSSGRQS